MKIIAGALAAATIVLGAGAASAQDAAWYVQGSVGGTFDSQLEAAPKHEGDAGWSGGAAVGRELGNGVRLETELAYARADLKGLTGKTSALGGFVNAYYDFLRDSPVQPFVGAGLGMAQVTSRGDDDTGFAYQLKAGLAHRFNERLTGEVAYRYIRVLDVQGAAGGRGFDGDYDTSAVTVGLRYKLGQ